MRWPTLLAAVIWTVLLVMSWGSLVSVGSGLITGLPLVGGWLASSEGALLVALLMFKIGLVMLALPIIYVTAAFLVAAVALPLMLDGKILGAIGVSGVQSNQDGQIAKAGHDAFLKIAGK